MNKFVILLIIAGLQEIISFWTKPLEIHFHEEETFNLFENFNETSEDYFS